MKDYIIWSEDLDIAYGKISDFTSEEEFVKGIHLFYSENVGEKCDIDNVRIESCISTANGVDAELLIPLSNTDVTIENYYVAEVYLVSKDEENNENITEIDRLLKNLKILIKAGMLEGEFAVFSDENPNVNSISELNDIIECEISYWEA